MLRRAELRGETDRAEHPERVVAVGLLRLQRGADYARRKVADASERIDKRAVVLLLQAERHRVDSEIPAFLILLKRTVLDNRLARIVAVGLLPGPDELNLRPVPLQHRGAESLEYGHVAMPAFLFLDLRGHCLGQLDPAPLHHDVDVIVRSAKEAVTHIASDHESPHAKFLRRR